MEYIIYQHTDMTEVRKLVDVPDDLQPAELPDYVDSHGAGDLLDICDDMTELVHVETKDGETVWDRPRVQPVSATLIKERERIARHIDDYRGNVTNDVLAQHMRAEGHTGWTAATVRDILALKRDITLSEAQTLSVLLGVTIDMLMNGGQSLHGVGKPVHGVLNADGTLTIRVAGQQE